jgi:hypothetical protein
VVVDDGASVHPHCLLKGCHGKAIVEGRHLASAYGRKITYCIPNRQKAFTLLGGHGPIRN